MSSASVPIGLDLKLQPQPGHGNSKHHAPSHATSYSSSASSSLSSKRTSKTQKQTHYGDSSKNHPTSSAWKAPAVIREEKCSDIGATSPVGRESGREQQSPFDKDWVCTSQDFVHNRTPSRKDGIAYAEEMSQRRNGTAFIRQMASNLKLKPICKETAYLYFHRFYMLRSLKKHDPIRLAMACLYLACKFEDHPTFKEHLIRVAYLNRHKRDLSKTEKEYAEWSERLIRDENQLLQVLGFNLNIEHYQLNIVAASQHPIQGASKALYKVAFKISSEINRLTMLCVEYHAPILTCVTIYLAAVYQGFALPDDWCASIAGATIHDRSLVTRIGEEYKELIATHSDLVKSILKESGVKCHKTTICYSSPNEACRGSTPQHSAFFGKDQPFLTNFSPDSAYSSNSSHSPPENGNSSFHSRTAQTYPSNTSMMNYPASQFASSKRAHQQLLYPSDANYSPTEMGCPISKCLPTVESHTTIYNTTNLGSVANANIRQGAPNQSNNHFSSQLPIQSNYKIQKRREPSTSLTLNPTILSHVGSSASGLEMAKRAAGSVNDSHRKRIRSEHHSSHSSSKHQSSHMHSDSGSRLGTDVSNNSRMMLNSDPSFNQLHETNYRSMPHF